MESLRKRKADLARQMAMEADAAFDQQDRNRDNVISFDEGLTPETVGGVRSSRDTVTAPTSRSNTVLDALDPEAHHGHRVLP